MKSADARRGGLLGPVLQSYFCDYLINQRRLSDCTVAAYRDTFKLLLAFLERKLGLKPDDLRAQSIGRNQGCCRKKFQAAIGSAERRFSGLRVTVSGRSHLRASPGQRSG